MGHAALLTPGNRPTQDPQVMKMKCEAMSNTCKGAAWGGDEVLMPLTGHLRSEGINSNKEEASGTWDGETYGAWIRKELGVEGAGRELGILSRIRVLLIIDREVKEF